MERHYLSVIRVWAALAWSDDVIVEQEAVALRRLIERAPMLTAEERETALSFLTHRVDLDEDALASLSPEAARGVYRAAVHLAAIDREFAIGERLFLDRLADVLGISEREAEAIEDSVPQLAESS